MSLKRKATDSAATTGGDAKKSKANSSITSFFGAPRSAKAEEFDKDKWVAGLTAEQKELLKLEIDTLHESWLAHLHDELVKPDFLKLKKFLKKEKEGKVTVFPPEGDIYSWYVRSSHSFQYCSTPSTCFATRVTDPNRYPSGPVTHPSTPSKW